MNVKLKPEVSDTVFQFDDFCPRDLSQTLLVRRGIYFIEVSGEKGEEEGEIRVREISLIWKVFDQTPSLTGITIEYHIDRAYNLSVVEIQEFISPRAYFKRFL